MPLGGGPRCPVCQKTVYFNEERRALGKIFHVTCFKCELCKKSLDSTNCSEHEDSLYCSGCYRKQFGPTGYGFAGGAAGLSTTSGQRSSVIPGLGGPANSNGDPSDPENCPTCCKRVYFAEQVLALQRKWHKLCFKCTTCRKSLDSTSATEHDMQPYCKACYAKNFGPSGYGFAGGAAGLSTTNGKSLTSAHHNGNATNGVGNKDDPENCPRCGKRVYFAEQLLSLNRKWHKLCFKCVSCNKTVDSTSAADHEGELYCRSCHSRHFGIKGVGYGIGAGTLSTV